MIKLRNLLIWDGAMSPVRIPEINVDPAAMQAAGDEGWIVCGPYRIKIVVDGGSPKGLTIRNSAGKILRSGMSGAIFLDQQSFTIEPAEGYSALGHVSGCVDISWP